MTAFTSTLGFYLCILTFRRTTVVVIATKEKRENPISSFINPVHPYTVRSNPFFVFNDPFNEYDRF